ncbi:hypothetical protein B5807_11750 [Epicoccum nigrum]|uniref:Uncharacterized protein n=1 Tax=Epicoccum nigrum TaxID=105696 RepID=A0A1Y2LL37_EPING|nr:hypothetical protein B5807_11750 [Epicoccum nigrum]
MRVNTQYQQRPNINLKPASSHHPLRQPHNGLLSPVSVLTLSTLRHLTTLSPISSPSLSQFHSASSHRLLSLSLSLSLSISHHLARSLASTSSPLHLSRLRIRATTTDSCTLQTLSPSEITQPLHLRCGLADLPRRGGGRGEGEIETRRRRRRWRSEAIRSLNARSSAPLKSSRSPTPSCSSANETRRPDRGRRVGGGLGERRAGEGLVQMPQRSRRELRRKRAGLLSLHEEEEEEEEEEQCLIRRGRLNEVRCERGGGEAERERERERARVRMRVYVKDGMGSFHLCRGS